MEPGGYVCVVYVLGHPSLSQKNWGRLRSYVRFLPYCNLELVLNPCLQTAWRESERPGGHLRHKVYSLLRRQHAEQGKHYKYKESLSLSMRESSILFMEEDNSVLMRSPDIHQLLRLSSSVKELLVNLWRRNLNPLWYLCRQLFPGL